VIKWDELRWILESNGIGLWCLYAYATMIIFDYCICFVEVLEHVYLVLWNCSGNVESCENRRTLLKCGFITGWLVIEFVFMMIWLNKNELMMIEWLRCWLPWHG
jgi:hypothetical protein